MTHRPARIARDARPAPPAPPSQAFVLYNEPYEDKAANRVLALTSAHLLLVLLTGMALRANEAMAELAAATKDHEASSVYDDVGLAALLFVSQALVVAYNLYQLADSLRGEYTKAKKLAPKVQHKAVQMRQFVSK